MKRILVTLLLSTCFLCVVAQTNDRWQSEMLNTNGIFYATNKIDWKLSDLIIYTNSSPTRFLFTLSTDCKTITIESTNVTIKTKLPPTITQSNDVWLITFTNK